MPLQQVPTAEAYLAKLTDVWFDVGVLWKMSFEMLFASEALSAVCTEHLVGGLHITRSFLWDVVSNHNTVRLCC